MNFFKFFGRGNFVLKGESSLYLLGDKTLRIGTSLKAEKTASCHGCRPCRALFTRYSAG